MANLVRGDVEESIFFCFSGTKMRIAIKNRCLISKLNASKQNRSDLISPNWTKWHILCLE